MHEGQTTLPGGHFSFDLVPGQSISDGVVVENFSNHSLDFHIYGADLLSASGGGFAPGSEANAIGHKLARDVQQGQILQTSDFA